MTQYQKDFVKKAILKVAQDEFLENGFAKTSMRTIAKKAEVTLSNIYNYFKNKDELLKEVLSPILSDIERGKEALERHETCHTRTDLDGHHDFILPAVDFVHEHKECLKLLAFKSTGSSLANYKDELVDWYVNKMNRKIEIAGNHHDLSDFGISKAVLRALAFSWITFIESSISSDQTLEKSREDIKNLMTFTHCGWHGLIEEKLINS